MSHYPQITSNDFTRDPVELIGAQIQACQRVFSSGRWILSEAVSRFEHEWSQYCKCDHAIGVANGMDAIEISLRCLGIGPGDEIITTSLTAFATTLAILRCGALPVYADIDMATGCLDPISASKCVTPATRAILVVHLYGRASKLDQFVDLCASHGIYLIEDCAQAHGASFQGAPVGTHGVAGAWSFYPTKNLGAIGDGGAITTSSPELAELARSIRNYGQSDRYHHEVLGVNSRLDEIQAAISLERLHYLPFWTERRRSIALRYWDEIINTNLTLLEKPSHPSNHVHHLFIIRTSDRQRLQDHLLKQGINALIHYPIPCHRQPAIQASLSSIPSLPNTTIFADTCLSLPIHPYLTDREVSQVISACNSFV